MFATTRRIIFHIPMKLNRAHASASQIRPWKLIHSFQDMGYIVDVVDGQGKERKKKIAAIKQEIKNGTHYDFLYSESSVMPTLLTEKHHFPLFPFLDFSFFHFCKKNSIPIGLFYRDIHWCFINKNKDWKQRVAKYFYQYDLRQYEKYLDVLFLPTLNMLSHIPFHFSGKAIGLPAGCECHVPTPAPQHNPLHILYIGGIGGNYDLKKFLEAVRQSPFTHLTLCCRQDDWQKVQDTYHAFENASNISIVHKKDHELKELYEQSDLFSLLISPTPYIAFAAPYKLFEAIGYQKPLIGFNQCWSGQFIEKQNIGLTCNDSIEDIVRCLKNLHKNPALLETFHQNLQEIVGQHTWQHRCQEIAEALNPNLEQ